MLRKILLTTVLISISTYSLAQNGRELIDDLKMGGYTIFFRHSITDGTDPNKVNPPNENMRDCNTQRPLNEVGREQARLMGQKFREYGIPIGDVFASLVCRCEETAKLAFGKVAAVEWMVLKSSLNGQPELEKNMLSVPSTGFFNKAPSKKNNIYVGHAQTLSSRMLGSSFPLVRLEEGEGIVFDPENKRYVGRIFPSKW